MEPTIKKYVENKHFSSELIKKNIKMLDSEEILGSLDVVAAMAVIWQVNKDTLKTIELALLLDYCQSRVFTKEEFESFRFGLSAMNLFLENCLFEIEDKQKDGL